MQRIALAQIGSTVVALPHRRQGLGGAAPDLLVGLHHLLHPAAVDRFEEAPCQHLHRFVFAGGGEGRDLPSRDRLQLSEDPIDPLVLLPISIHGLAALAQGQGEHQHRLGGGAHRLDQVGEEGSELLSGLAGSGTLDLAQVDRKLIDQDQHRPLADQLPQGFSARRGCPKPVAIADALVARRASQLHRQLPPGREGEYVGLHPPAVHRVGVLPVEGRDRDLLAGQAGWIDELRQDRSGDLIGGREDVVQADQGVRLAAAIAGVEPQDAAQLAAGAGEPVHHRQKQVAQAPGGVRVREEQGRVLVELRRRALQHLAEVRREVLVSDPPFQHVGPGPAELVDGGRAHGVVGTALASQGARGCRAS